MTDYLEQLLDVWQEEDESGTLMWKRKSRKRYEPIGEERGQRSKVETAESLSTGEPVGQRERWMQQSTVEYRESDVVEKLERLERAVVRGKTGRARAGAWKVSGAMQAAEGLTMPQTGVAQTGVQRRLATLLDTAFERDARRYDGPLGLF